MNRICAQLLLAAVPILALAVATPTAGDQSAPAAAMTAGGRLVIVWQSEGQNGHGEGIFAQRFRPDGSALGLFAR